MGASGYDIFDDDLACDVRGYLLDLFDQGLSIDKLKKISISEFEPSSFDIADFENYYGAFAITIWNLGGSTTEHIAELRNLMISGKSYQFWVSEFGELIAEQRLRILENLLKKMESPCRNPRKRKAPIRFEPFLEEGCIYNYQTSPIEFSLLLITNVQQIQDKKDFYHFARVLNPNINFSPLFIDINLEEIKEKDLFIIASSIHTNERSNFFRIHQVKNINFKDESIIQVPFPHSIKEYTQKLIIKDNPSQLNLW